MYDKPFLIREPVSNNAFSRELRPGAVLFVAALRDGVVADVKPGKAIAFEDIDDDGNLRSCNGLAEFVRIKWGKIPVYVFDNHNHSFAFWHLEMIRGTIPEGCTIIHVDQHKDCRTPETFLQPGEARVEDAVFGYTNSTLNVGNFIPPALITGLAREVINVDSEAAIDDFDFSKLAGDQMTGRGIILDLDLDFFSPDMDYIPEEKKLGFIEKVAPRASLLTVATSPFFIAQDRAVGVFGKIVRRLHID
jgi:hypothetical protein